MKYEGNGRLKELIAMNDALDAYKQKLIDIGLGDELKNIDTEDIVEKYTRFLLEREKEGKPKEMTCPYCGGQMRLAFVDRRAIRYSPVNRATDEVVYKCGYCNATSPTVYVAIKMLDEKAVQKTIEKIIEDAKDEIKCDQEEEEENDD